MTKLEGVNQNYLHELNICRGILEREQATLDNHRVMIEMNERFIRMDLERIQLVKRRIMQLESHANDRM